MNPIRPFLDKAPQLGARVYVDPACTLIGDVVLGEDVSVWPGTVIRGDVNHVRIGARSNIQDGTILHACTIKDLCLIGMGACILDGATVKKYGFVGAGVVSCRARPWASANCGWAIRRGWRARSATRRSRACTTRRSTTCA